MQPGMEFVKVRCIYYHTSYQNLLTKICWGKNGKMIQVYSKLILFPYKLHLITLFFIAIWFHRCSFSLGQSAIPDKFNHQWECTLLCITDFSK
jgi:hypothetical protein